MEVIPGSVRSNGNGAGVGAGGRMGSGRTGDDTKSTGRKDGDGQEAVVDLGALKKGMPKAIKLEKDLADARGDASKFYKKFAKECGLNTAQLKKAAKAYADEDAEAARRKADQLSLIFTECGA